MTTRPPPKPCAEPPPAPANHYTDRCSQVGNFNEHTWGHSMSAITCPIPASSGNTVRHRLNRGGDRRLNRALTTVVIVRMRTHAATRAYVARRRAEGRTTKEIMRSLKRYITRQLYRTLAAAHPAPAST